MLARRALLLIAVLLLGLGVWLVTRDSDRGDATATGDAGTAAAPDAPATLTGGEAVPADSAPAVTATEEPTERVAVRHAETGALTVLVVSSEDGAPEPGLSVFLRPAADTPGLVLDPDETTGLSDAAGRVELSPPAGVAFEVLASGFDGDGIEVQDAVALAALAPGERAEVTIEITRPPRHAFFGRLVDRDGGAPIAGAVAQRLVDDQLRVLSRAECPGPSTADGLLHLALRAWRRPSVRIDAQGYSPVFVELAAGHETAATALSIPLRPSASVLATVLDPSGAPIENVAVVLSADAYDLNHQRDVFDFFGGYRPRWNRMTDARGQARIPDLPSEVPLAVVASNTRLPFRWIEPLVLEPGELRELEVRLDAGQRVAGRVTDGDGAPIVSHIVWLLPHASGVRPPFDGVQRSYTETEPDDDGRFEFGGIPAGRWYLLLEPRSSRSALTAVPALAPAHVEFDVRPGQDVGGLELVVGRGLAIRGVVLDAAGRPAASVNVDCTSEDRGQRLDDYTGEDGSFVFGPVGPGAHRLWANDLESGAAGSRPVVVQAGATDVVLRLRPGGSVSGLVVDAAGGSFDDAWIMVRAIDREADDVGFSMRSKSLRGPEFELTGLLDGTWSIWVVDRDGDIGLAPPIALGPGERVEGVEIHLEPGGRVRTRLRASAEASAKDHGRFELWAGTRLVAADGVRAGASAVKTVPPGPVTVKAWFPRDVPLGERTVDVAAGEEIEVVFEPGR
jgi:hypothetical protein